MIVLFGWVDTHSHLQALDEAELKHQVEAARSAGMLTSIICAASPLDWDACVHAARSNGLHYMLGIHPLHIRSAEGISKADFRSRVEQALSDPCFVGIGEVGLDGIAGCTSEAEKVFAMQLEIASEYDLPVSMHGRKASSKLVKHLRRFKNVSGVHHAFNGSDEEKKAFLDLGFALGFGGAATYAGSIRIRRHLAQAAADQYVLETDCPDMPADFRRNEDPFNPSSRQQDLSRYIEVFSEIRGEPPEKTVRDSSANALRIFPRLASTINQ